jgi:hypothetical protein
MANHDPNHSSHEKTILWLILPATVAVSLLFTNLNHKIEGPAERLSAAVEPMKKVEVVAQADTTNADIKGEAHTDTSHTEAPAH